MATVPIICAQSHMKRLQRRSQMTGVAFLLAYAPPSACAAEITVLSGGAIEPGLNAAAAAFEKQSGHTVKITFNTTPQMRSASPAGDTFDVVVAPPAAIEGFAKDGQGRTAAASTSAAWAWASSCGRARRGRTCRAPTRSSASVLDAESIVFNRASTGIYFENLLKKMGVYEQVEAKTARYADGASVMEHVLKGKGREVGFGAITEILLYKDKGLILVGPLPADVQNYTSLRRGADDRRRERGGGARAREVPGDAGGQEALRAPGSSRAARRSANAGSIREGAT